MQPQTKQNLLNADIWIRLIYMVVFACLMVLARLFIYTAAVIQAIAVLITGDDLEKVREVADVAAKWQYQAASFLTFNSEQKPFPFDDWPEPNRVEKQVEPAPTSSKVEDVQAEASDEKTTNEQTGDEQVGDEQVGDEQVGDEQVGDEQVGNSQPDADTDSNGESDADKN